MKKTIFLPILGTSMLIMTLSPNSFSTIHSSETTDSKISEEVTTENLTKQVLSEYLIDKSEEEIESYFGNLPDDQWIVAVRSGGGFSYMDDNSLNGVVEIRDKNDNIVEYVRYSDENVAAKIGEVKEYVKTLKENHNS